MNLYRFTVRKYLITAHAGLVLDTGAGCHLLFIIIVENTLTYSDTFSIEIRIFVQNYWTAVYLRLMS